MRTGFRATHLAREGLNRCCENFDPGPFEGPVSLA